MIHTDIYEEDNFLELSKDAKILYTYLMLSADGYGVTNKVKKSANLVDLSKEETDNAIKELLENGYILQMDNNFIVITHWDKHNTIAKNRRGKPTNSEILKKIKRNGNKYEITDESSPESVYNTDIKAKEKEAPQQQQAQKTADIQAERPQIPKLSNEFQINQFNACK